MDGWHVLKGCPTVKSLPNVYGIHNGSEMKEMNDDDGRNEQPGTRTGVK